MLQISLIAITSNILIPSRADQTFSWFCPVSGQKVTSTIMQVSESFPQPKHYLKESLVHYYFYCCCFFWDRSSCYQYPLSPLLYLNLRSTIKWTDVLIIWSVTIIESYRSVWKLMTYFEGWSRSDAIHKKKNPCYQA